MLKKQQQKNTFTTILSVKTQTKKYKLISISQFEHAAELVEDCLKCVKFLDQHWVLTPRGDDIHDLVFYSVYYNDITNEEPLLK